MYKIILFFSLALPVFVQAQLLESKSYEWPANPSLHKVTAEEAAQSAVILEDDRQYEFIFNKNGDLEVYNFRHRLIRINDSKALDDFNKIYVAVGHPSMLISFKARSIDKNGKVKEMLLGEMKEVDHEGRKFMSLAVDGLEKDSELEYYFTTKLEGSSFLAELVHTDFLLKNYTLKIISPEGIVLEAKGYNGFSEFADTIINRKRILSAQISNIVPLQKEDYASEDANQLRCEMKIAKNLTKNNDRLFTWSDAGNRYYDRLFNYEKNEKNELEKILKKLQLKDKSETEVIRAIENYVKTSFEIVDNVEFNSIVDIVKNKYADQFGIYKLTTGLLKHAGVKFELVVTISRFKKKFDPDFDTWNFLDDVLFYFPANKTVLDPVNYGYRYGLLPSQYIGVSGLFIKEINIGDVSSAVSSIKTLPTPDSTLHSDIFNADLNFSADMSSIQQKTTHTFSGYSSIPVRPIYFYSPEDKRKEQLVNLLKYGIEDATVTNSSVSNFDLASDEVDKPFTISGDVKYSSLVEKAGSTILFNVGGVIGPQFQLYNEKPRQQPIEIEVIHWYLRNITVRIPEGYTVTGLEALNMSILSDDGSRPSMGFISSYKLNGNILEITVKEYYNKISYPKSYYSSFQKVINAAADFNKIKLTFEKS